MNSRPGGTPPPARKGLKTKISLVLGVLITVAVFAWLGKNVIENWDELSTQISQASPLDLAGAVVSFLVFTVLIGLCYAHSLRLAGARVGSVDAVGVYLASQLGKYVPGKVVYLAGQIGLAKLLRVSVTQSALGITAHHIMIAASGLLLASPLLGVALSSRMIVLMVVLAVVGFLLLATGVWVRPFNMLQRKRGKTEFTTFTPVHAVRALGSAVLGWFFYGCIAAFLCHSLLPDFSLSLAVQVGMAGVAAWLLGFLSFVTPAGVGVREGMFVLLTRAIIPEPTAMAVALLMRLLYTFLQLPIGALALSFIVRRRTPDVEGE